jgi:hypothetical protein
MSRFDQDIAELQAAFPGKIEFQKLPSGAHLVEIKDYPLVSGWSREAATILFIAPPAFPAAQPDCFWAEPVGLRLANGDTPQASNDASPVPEVGQRGTWFSWHLQHWNPNKDTLMSYFRVILKRLDPPR